MTSRLCRGTFGSVDIHVPKYLGDLVESITGAVFLDSGKNLDITWQVLRKVLEPLVTPDDYPIHPTRVLFERCG